ncbi:hypothetical protein Hanom_Chr12g01135161 [Helianthus anomalus]
MGAKKDLSDTFSSLTQEDVEAFLLEWGIGLKFKPVAQGCDKSVDQCPSGSIAMYCQHFEFSNLHRPFSNFVLNVLEYYHVSFGQIHPQGLARVLHYEVLYRSLGFDPSLLSFPRFFHLAKIGDWFTFETTKIDTCLVSSMRQPEGILNEPEPSESELNSYFLDAIRKYPSRVRPFPEHLLVLLGIDKLWDKSNWDPVLMRVGQVMSALDFVKSDDTSDVVFTDAEAAEGEDVVARGSEQRLEGSAYVSFPNIKGFTKVPVPKVSTRRSNRRLLKGADQPSGSEAIDISDHIEMSVEQGVKVGDSVKDPAVCADVLAKSVPPSVRDSIAEMDGDTMISRLIFSSCNLSALLAEGVNRFCKGMQDYEELMKKKDIMKTSIASMTKEIDGFAKKEGAWVKKMHEVTSRHDVEERLKASEVRLVNENRWLIEHGFQQVVTILLHSSKFNQVLGVVYTKLLAHGRHQGLIIGYKACEAGEPQDKSPLFQPQALKGLKPHGLNEVVCKKVLESLSKKCSCSGDSEETMSAGGEALKERSLEASEAASEGRKKKKAKKAKDDGAGVSKPSTAGDAN